MWLLYWVCFLTNLVDGAHVDVAAQGLGRSTEQIINHGFRGLHGGSYSYSYSYSLLLLLLLTLTLAPYSCSLLLLLLLTLTLISWNLEQA